MDAHDRSTTIIVMLAENLTVIAGLALVAALILMMPQGNDRNNFNYRITPSWSPENDQTYSHPRMTRPTASARS